jgi:CheY-like chemotaxis protein
VQNSVVKRPHTVLIVDDDLDLLAVMVRLCWGQDYTTLAARNGDEALAIMAVRPVEVILCDQGMPGLTGSEVLRKIRRQWPETMRILMTGDVNLEAALRVVAEGEAHRFILKPWHDAELLVTIRQTIDRWDLIKRGGGHASLGERANDQAGDLEVHYPDISRITGSVPRHPPRL